jgi:hypothetical protein
MDVRAVHLLLVIGQNTPLCLTDAHVPRGAILVEVTLTLSFSKKSSLRWRVFPEIRSEGERIRFC